MGWRRWHKCRPHAVFRRLEQRSPKPRAVSSSLTTPATSRQVLGLAVFSLKKRSRFTDCRSFFPQSTRLCGSPEAAYDFFFVSRLLLFPQSTRLCGSPENLFQSPAPLFLLSRLPPRSAISDCHRQSSPHKTHCVGLLREPWSNVWLLFCVATAPGYFNLFISINI